MSRDEEFFFSLITFEVEGHLFRVPRKPFEDESHVFRDMFSLPSKGEAFEGSGEALPLRLEGIKSEDFRNFLKIIHTPHYRRKVSLTVEQWVAVLNLAHMWGFGEIQQLPIRELEAVNVDMVLKIELARKYSIESWLRPALRTIRDRKESLTDVEVCRLGWKLASQIFRIRETKYQRYVEHLEQLFSKKEKYACMDCGSLEQEPQRMCPGCGIYKATWTVVERSVSSDYADRAAELDIDNLIELL
ncbi:hypothetical protein DFH11DRAFT_1501444 [Phellopilus nigrolimitatus]|nr:hypothetical protein DFH11DRAFT_1501444 [Phellopilus nigrolimitatus]